MFEQAEFTARRQNLLAQMSANAVAIIATNPEQHRSGDTHFRFRPDSNFYYLSGFEEPEAVMVLINSDTPQYLMFNRSNNKLEEIWHGRRQGQEGVCENYGVDRAHPIEQLDIIMPELLTDCDTLYYCHGANHTLDEQVAKWCQQVRAKVRTGVSAPQRIVNLTTVLNEMRLIKSEAEIEVMQQVGEISAKAHTVAMQQCKHLDNEYQIHATLMHQFMLHGCSTSAYDSIVGGGENACILHYTENNARLNPGELLLVDAGGELHNYAADITRTYPINGVFTPEQRQIYQLVLKAQKAGIDCVKPDTPWNQIQQTMVETLTQGLCQLGLIKLPVAEAIDTLAYRQFYMHNSGHWLGLDVHDVGDYKIEGNWRNLQPGMVLTVEPGLYIAGDNPDIDEKWWNIGVRIEDDILVTADGHHNLTASVVKEIDDIEALMA